ncbi:transposase [Lysobacter yananisis]|uniref:Transposase n=2 Tax=Lysobacter yananisis TaxID=1003114 RepID=A0ABY9PC79_9GAMM|nr:transposase [Lysobacter yananisis]WMT04018.1 transposase [Lysobacter yananisis]
MSRRKNVLDIRRVAFSVTYVAGTRGPVGGASSSRCAGRTIRAARPQGEAVNPKALIAARAVRTGAAAPRAFADESAGGRMLAAARSRASGDDHPHPRSAQTRTRLDDAQWRAIAARLPPTLTRRAQRNAPRYRRFVEDVLQVAAGDLRWRELEPNAGSWRTVYMRFLRWCEDGVWDGVIDALQAEPELARALRRRVDEHRRASGRRRQTAAPKTDAAARAHRRGDRAR